MDRAAESLAERRQNGLVTGRVPQTCRVWGRPVQEESARFGPADRAGRSGQVDAAAPDAAQSTPGDGRHRLRMGGRRRPAYHVARCQHRPLLVLGSRRRSNGPTFFSQLFCSLFSTRRGFFSYSFTLILQFKMSMTRIAFFF